MSEDGSDVSELVDQLAEIKGERSDADDTADQSAGANEGEADREGGDADGTDAGETDTDETDSSDWRTYFPFDEPYPGQRAGIERTVETATEGGYGVVEGACGSGKTLLSLLAGISLVRDPDTSYERVFVVTSVKQQLQQFENDLRAINRNLDGDVEPVTGTTLVGKTEMCPYTAAEGNDITESNVNRRCSELREATRDQLDDTSAGALVERAKRGSGTLATDGARAPFPEGVPSSFCPFYANYLGIANDDEASLPLPFEEGDGNVLDPKTIRRAGVSAGICPHSLMAERHVDADVVIGNYYHLFSPSARRLTDPVVDEETFLVVDEAHTLEERVRGLFETSISIRRLETAIAEIDQVLDEVSGDGPATDVNRVEFEQGDATVDALRETRELLDWIHSRVDRRIEMTLEHSHGEWQENWGSLPERREIELRDPEQPGPDEISKWAGEAGFDEADWKRPAAIGAAVERYLTPEENPEEVTVVLPDVGMALQRWHDCDHTNHFREIELHRSSAPSVDVSEWDDVYNGRLVMHSCLPRSELAGHLDEFGGGILMSATLEPLSVFEEVVGLSELDRPVTELQYPLRFPEANRESLAVSTTQFTQANRNDESVRAEYANVVERVAATPGNVLICMPSYAEAEWAAGVLEESSGLDKPVLLDESSANAETQRLKERFFMSPAKVLVTSVRGTLTEGVDYAGDKLSAALVCSVPFVKLGPQTRAVVTAYEAAFGADDGFDYALTIPAVRKARQAVGRVIRGPDERGIRVLADERYTTTQRWNSARGYLSEAERAEFDPVSLDDLDERLRAFWRE